MDRPTRATVVEIDSSGLTWRKSSASGGGGGEECVELAFRPATVLIRDSKDRAGARLRFVADAWAEFLGQLRR